MKKPKHSYTNIYKNKPSTISLKDSINRRWKRKYGNPIEIFIIMKVYDKNQVYGYLASDKEYKFLVFSNNKEFKENSHYFLSKIMKNYSDVVFIADSNNMPLPIRGSDLEKCQKAPLYNENGKVTLYKYLYNKYKRQKTSK